MRRSAKLAAGGHDRLHTAVAAGPCTSTSWQRRLSTGVWGRWLSGGALAMQPPQACTVHACQERARVQQRSLLRTVRPLHCRRPCTSHPPGASRAARSVWRIRRLWRAAPTPAPSTTPATTRCAGEEEACDRMRSVGSVACRAAVERLQPRCADPSPTHCRPAVLPPRPAAQPVPGGQMVLLDGGCELNGYCSDVTRTWPVGGKYSGAQRGGVRGRAGRAPRVPGGVPAGRHAAPVTPHLRAPAGRGAGAGALGQGGVWGRGARGSASACVRRWQKARS